MPCLSYSFTKQSKTCVVCHIWSPHTASPWWQGTGWETLIEMRATPRTAAGIGDLAWMKSTARTKYTGDLMSNFFFFFFFFVNHQLTSLWDEKKIAVWKIAKSSSEWKNQFSLKTGYLPTLGRTSIFVLSLLLKIRCLVTVFPLGTAGDSTCFNFRV